MRAGTARSQCMRQAGTCRHLTGQPFKSGGPPARLRCVLAHAATATSKQSVDGLIFPAGVSGAWDEGGVGHPVVRCFVGDNEERWFMWYSGRSVTGPGPVDLVAAGAGSMGVAISNDGITWQRGAASVAGEKGELADQDVGSTIVPNKDWWTFDTCHLAPGDVQVLSSGSVDAGVGVYWCFYAGGDFAELPVPAGMPSQLAAGAMVEGLRTRPGLAMSQDARNWARIEGDHHTGALFDVGAVGEWDELFVAQPQVVQLGPRDMRMFYHSWDQAKGRFVVGVAKSPDGFTWTKHGVVFDTVSAGAQPGDHDALGSAARHVVRDVDNRQFVMFYEAVAQGGQRSIGLAVSKDGDTWNRCPSPVLTGSADSSWDKGAVGAPSVVSMAGGLWRLYYCGLPQDGTGPWTGIGLALSAEGSDQFEGVPIQYKRV